MGSGEKTITLTREQQQAWHEVNAILARTDLTTKQKGDWLESKASNLGPKNPCYLCYHSTALGQLVRYYLTETVPGSGNRVIDDQQRASELMKFSKDELKSEINALSTLTGREKFYWFARLEQITPAYMEHAKPAYNFDLMDQFGLRFYLYEFRMPIEQRAAELAAKYKPDEIRRAIIGDENLSSKEKVDWFIRLGGEIPTIQSDLPRLITGTVHYEWIHTAMNGTVYPQLMDEWVAILQAGRRLFPNDALAQGAFATELNALESYRREKEEKTHLSAAPIIDNSAVPKKIVSIADSQPKLQSIPAKTNDSAPHPSTPVYASDHQKETQELGKRLSRKGSKHGKKPISVKDRQKMTPEEKNQRYVDIVAGGAGQAHKSALKAKSKTKNAHLYAERARQKAHSLAHHKSKSGGKSKADRYDSTDYAQLQATAPRKTKRPPTAVPALAAIYNEPIFQRYLAWHPTAVATAWGVLNRYGSFIKSDCAAALKVSTVPSAGELGAMIALHYLVCEEGLKRANQPLESFLNGPEFMHSILHAETLFNPYAVGYTNGVRNGWGPYQFTPRVFWGIGYNDINREGLNILIRSWDPNGGLDQNITKFFNPKTKQMEDIILVSDGGRLITPDEWKTKNHTDGRVAPAVIVWNPNAMKLLQDPAFTVDKALVVMIYKGARPGMGPSTAYETAFHYNGNVKRRNGVPVQVAYASHVTDQYMPYYRNAKKEALDALRTLAQNGSNPTIR